MKHTIICCDLCNGRIYRDGWFMMEEGAVKLRVKVLTKVPERLADIPVTYSEWKRRTLHICPKCVDRIKKLCKGGESDAQET